MAKPSCAATGSRQTGELAHSNRRRHRLSPFPNSPVCRSSNRPVAELPCVIYLHGNSSCRVAVRRLRVCVCVGVCGCRCSQRFTWFVFPVGRGCQAIENLEVVLSLGITMFSIDFAGSGRSGGEWVTLGEFEKDDVATVRP